VARRLLLTFLFVVTPLLGQESIVPSATGQSPHKVQHPRKDVATIAKETKGAVVSIVMADKSEQPIAQGSGFVVTKNGLVVTNYHVIKSGSSAIVKLPDGSFFTVDGVLAFDKKRDIAVIKAHGNNFKTVALGDSDRLQVGEEVVAIGSPLSLESTVSNGIVSGVRSEDEDSFGPVNPLLQITAPISHGSSGGPLFNMFGEVVGITSAALTGGENLNFAVPINDAKKLIKMPPAQALLAFPDEPEEKATASSDQQSDLKSTVNFMRKMVEPDGESIDFVDTPVSCNIAYSGTARVAILRDGEKRDKDGNEVPTFSILKEWTHRNVSLGAIDPSRILSGPGFSYEYFEKTRGAGEGDLTLVNFQDADGSFKNFGFLIFLSQDRAERFVTAMKHAILLCGGKAGQFAPTPAHAQQDQGPAQQAGTGQAPTVFPASAVVNSEADRCSSTAKDFFQRYKSMNNNGVTAEGLTTFDYSTRYDPQNHACYLWVHEVNRSSHVDERDGNVAKVVTTSESIVDVFQPPNERQRAEWIFGKSLVISYSLVSACTVSPVGESAIPCNSFQEFKDLVHHYFGMDYSGRGGQ
jgi:V8-like Glu-specific endopeptidase